MKKIYSLALALAVLMGGASCAQDEALQTELTQAVPAQKPQGARIDLAVDSEFDLADLPGDEETARSLQLGQENGIPHIKLPLGDSQLRVFLRKIGATDATTTSAYIPAKVSYDDTSKRYRIVAKGAVQLQSASDRFDQGEWYIAAIWDGASPTAPTTEAERLSHRLTTLQPINATGITMDNPLSIQVPVVSKWTRIDNSLSGGTTLTKLDLEFRPLGVLLALNLTNQTVYPVNVSYVTAGFTGFAVDGSLTVEGVDDQKLRDGASLELVNSTNTERFITPSPVTIQPFEDVNAPVYMWLYPKSGATAGHEISFSFASDRRTAMSSELNAKDQFGANFRNSFQDFYTVDFAFDVVPKNGTYFVKDYGLRSQLTITEYFLNRYNNKSYGYVEIYNPNTLPVVLENYALIRVMDERDATNEYMGHYYPQRTSIGDTSGQTHKTSVLSLGMKPGASPWVPNSLGINGRYDIEAGAPTAPMSVSYPAQEQVRMIKSRPTYKDGKYTLDAGQTMLVLFSAHMAAGSTLQDPVPGDKNALALPEYINQAFDKGYCQYVVVLNNPTSDAGNYLAETNSPDAGVLNIGPLDALALVQKHQGNQKRRRGVDATSLTGLMYLGNGNWPFYRANVATGGVHFRGRSAAQKTSDSHFHSYEQFFQARLEDGTNRPFREYLGSTAPVDPATGQATMPLPSKVVSPGVRRYVGNTKAAWDALPNFNIRTSAY
ncbi:MAG: hypothetical protein SPK09_01830 [Porphyromonas sp.]|nr:hypothetical protein [Porphyromonas sp.]